MWHYGRHGEIRTKFVYSVKRDTVDMGKLRHARHDCSPGCSVEATLSLIDGKWKGVILHHLSSGVLRFNELRRQMPNVTQRMLTSQLRELEDDGLVHREIYPQVPPKVEYSLTPLGQSLSPVIATLRAWGEAHFDFENNAWKGKPEAR